jgi:hypothetical protein
MVSLLIKMLPEICSNFDQFSNKYLVEIRTVYNMGSAIMMAHLKVQLLKRLTTNTFKSGGISVLRKSNRFQFGNFNRQFKIRTF